MKCSVINSNDRADRIIIIGAFRFPKGDAGGRRTLDLGKALREAGYGVSFCGLPLTPVKKTVTDKSFFYQGFEYWTFPDAGTIAELGGSKLFRYLRSGDESLSWLKSQDLASVKAIVAYGGTASFLIKLQRLCSKFGIPLVYDCVEWYSPKQRPGGFLGAVHLDDSLKMRFVLPRLDGIIGISSFFVKYYNKKNCATLLFPPVIDAKDPEWPNFIYTENKKRQLCFGFAGAPHRERWDSIFKALDLLESERIFVKIHIFRGKEADIIKALGQASSQWFDWRRHVVFRGDLERSVFLKAMAQCDASFLFREDARWSRACFPSKVPELLRLGLPLIYNDTSDLCQYLESGREGIFVDSLSESALANAIARFADLPVDKRVEMRIAAQRCAQEHFDYRKWVRPLETFMRILEKRVQ